MDLHALPRRDLQALAKRNGVKANMSNAAMADALAALPAVDGIEEYVQQPVAEPTPAAEPELQPEEEEKQAPAEEEEEEPEKQEVIVLDDSEEEEKDLAADQEEKAPALGVGRRRATRRTRAEPVMAPATRRRAAASKADKADAAVEAVPARATRGRSQRTVAEDEAPMQARRTSRRAVAKKAGTEHEDEEKGSQGDVSSDEGRDGAAQNEEQNAPVEEQSQEDEGETVKEDAAAEAVPARTTRGRSQRTAAADEAPKARRTSRRAGARKTGTEQEEEEKGTQGDVSDMEATMAAPVSSDDGGHGAAQNAPLEEQSQEDEGETEKQDAAAQAVPARATRARRQRTVESAAEEEAPKARRTSRRAVARKTAAEQGEEEKGAQDEPVEEQSQEGEGETEKVDTAAAAAVPARATRARSQRRVVWADQLPKTRRTSRKDAASKTSTEQEETQCDVSDVEAAVPAPVSSDEGGHAAEEMETAMDAQAEEQVAAVEAVPARATRARRQRTAVSAAEEVAPKARRTSRRAAARKTSTEQEEEEKATQGDVADVVEATVPAPVSSDEEADGSEEMEVAIDAQNEEQNELVEQQSQEEEGVLDIPAPVEEEPAVAEYCMADSSVQEQLVDAQQCGDSPIVLAIAEREGSDSTQNDAVSGEGIHPVSEDTEMMSVDEVLQTPLKSSEAIEENEVPTAEEVLQSADKAIDEQEDMAADVVTNNTDVSVEDMAGDASEEDEDCTAEHVDSSVQEPLVHVQQCEEIHLAEVLQSADRAVDEQEDMAADVVTNNTDVSVEDMAGDANKEDEDCTAEHVDSSVQEPLVHVQQCEEIHLAGEDAEMVPVNELQQAMLESGEATDEVDSASDVGEENEDCTAEEEQVAEAVDSSVQEPLVDVQQCESTEEIQLASEDTEMVHVLESGEATEDVDFTSDVSEETEDSTVEEEPPVADDDDSSVQEPLVDAQQCEATQEIPHASEDAEMVPVLESSEATEEVDFTSYASEEIEASTCGEMLQNAVKAVEENEVPTCGEMLQSAGQAVEETEDIAADEVPHNTDEYVEEKAVVATDEMPRISETMDQGVVEAAAVDNLSQATVTDDEGAVKESGFSCDLADVSVEEKEVVAGKGIPQSSATVEENVAEVFTVDNLSQATVTDHEGAIMESGFTCELMDVPVEEDEVVAADVVEGVVTVDSLLQATVTDEEGAVQESVFRCGLSVLSVDDEVVMAAEEMQLSSPTMNKSAEEEVVTVHNLSVTDDEWAVKESAFTSECTPVIDAARDFSDHIASPFSANVFEYATKSLSMGSVNIELMVSEPAAVPLSLCMYRSSGGKKNASEHLGVQRENEVKEGDEPEAVFGRIIHSPLTIRKLRMAVAQEIEADDVPPLTIRKQKMEVAQQNEAEDVPLCIFGSSIGKKNASESVAAQPENEVKEGKEPEAAFGRIMHSPLTIRKLRTAVAEENEADSVPPLTIRKLRMDASEPVAAQPENEVKEGKEPEAAFGRIMHSPLTIRKLRRAVAQENEAGSVPPLTIRKPRMAVAQENAADSVPLCIFSSSGGEENSAEPSGSLSLRKVRSNLSENAAVAQENEVKEGEKSSVPLDKLSLRKLRLKLKETLTAQKNIEPKRVALGRLDENVC